MNLVSAFDGQYAVPSRSYFSRTALPTLYSATKDKIRQELSTINYFSDTTDLWSSVTIHSFISYTVHFVDDMETSE